MALSLITTLVTVATASAALLDVDGAVIHVFEPKILFLGGEGGADIKITPQSLNAGSNGDQLQAQITLTGGCSQEDIDFHSLTLGVLGGSGSVAPVAEIARNKNKLIARFDRQAVVDLIGNPGSEDVALEVRGNDVNGCRFSGTDTIKFIPGGGGNNVDVDDGGTTTEPDGGSEHEEPASDDDVDSP